MALALTIPISMLVSLLFCLSGVPEKLECSAAFSLPGEEVTQECDHANAPAWKIQEPNDKPWCADADRGRKSGTSRGKTWHSVETCENTVSACLLPQVRKDIVCINVARLWYWRNKVPQKCRRRQKLLKSHKSPALKKHWLLKCLLGCQTCTALSRTSHLLHENETGLNMWEFISWLWTQPFCNVTDDSICRVKEQD